MSCFTPPWVSPSWKSLCFLDLVDYFLSDVQKVFSCYLFKYFLGSFLSLFSFWDSCSENVGAFNVVPEVFRLFFTYFCSLFCFVAVISIVLCSKWLIHSFDSVILLLILCSVLFISVCLFLNSSKSVVNTSCIFSILFPRSWIIFTITIIILFFLKGCLSLLLLKVVQSCLTLCDPMDCSSPGSSFHGIFQVRILEWVAFPFSRGSSQPKGWTQVSCIAGRFFTSWATREATSFSCFSGILSCPFIRDIIFCIFILINFLWCGFPSGSCKIAIFLASSSALCWIKLRGLCKLLMGGTKLHWVKLDLAPVDRVLLSKTLIQLAAYGWGCTPSLLAVCLEATQLWSLQALLLLFSS